MLRQRALARSKLLRTAPQLFLQGLPCLLGLDERCFALAQGLAIGMQPFLHLHQLLGLSFQMLALFRLLVGAGVQRPGALVKFFFPGRNRLLGLA